MKKLVMSALVCSVVSLNASAKMTYEDAVESNRPYKEARVYSYPDNEGLGPHEIPDTDSGGEGVWASATYNANHTYFGVSGDVTGKACSPVGIYAYSTYESCSHIGNGDFDCKIKSRQFECK